MKAFNRSCTNFIFILVGIFFFISCVSAVGTYPTVDPNMVLYYHFNNQSSYGENDTFVYDFSGNGNNGTANNTLFQAGTGILQDGSLNFNKINSSVTTNSPINLTNSNGITFSIWIKTSNASQNAYILDNLNQDEFSIYARLLSSSDIRFNFANQTNAVVVSTGSIASTLIDGYWHNVLGTWNLSSGIISVYLDGQLKATSSLKGTIRSISEVYKIGSRGGSTQFFDGNLDEAIIFNKSLSQSEVSELYNNYNNCGTVPFDGCSINNNTSFSKGVYNFSQEIKIVNNNIVIDGNGSTLYYDLNNVSKSIFNITNFNNITLKNFNIMSLHNSSSSGNTINIYGANGVYIYNNTINISSCYYQCNNVFAQYSSLVNVSNSNLFVNGNRTYNIYYQYVNDSVINNNILTVTNSPFASWSIHLENPSINNTISANYIYNEGRLGCGIYLEQNAINNNIISNYFYSSGIDGNGVCSESGSRYNNYLHNRIVINNSAPENYDRKYISGTGINLIDGSYHNYFFNTSISLYNSSLAIGIKVMGGTNSPNYNNTFVNTIFYNDLANNYLISFVDRSSNSTFNFTTLIPLTISKRILFYSSDVFNTEFNSFAGYSFNLIDRLRAIAILESEYLFFNNTNTTSSYIPYFKELTNALIYVSNGSAIKGSGNLNITVQPLNYSYVLDNFNLTEGVSRQYSPLWFSQSTSTEKHIASNLSDDVSVVVVTNLGDCTTKNKVTYTTDSGIKTTWTGDRATEVCEQFKTSGVTLLIEPAQNSNVIAWENSTTSLSRTILKITILFLAISALLVSVTIIMFYVKNNFDSINLLDFAKMTIFVLIYIVLMIIVINHIVDSI